MKIVTCTWEQLEDVIRTAKEHDYKLIAATQNKDVYTLFFELIE